jgi:hypothetical protein
MVEEIGRVVTKITPTNFSPPVNQSATLADRMVAEGAALGHTEERKHLRLRVMYCATFYALCAQISTIGRFVKFHSFTNLS